MLANNNDYLAAISQNADLVVTIEVIAHGQSECHVCTLTNLTRTHSPET
jgi:hypothetical protein